MVDRAWGSESSEARSGSRASSRQEQGRLGLVHRPLDCPVFQRLLVARLAGVVLGIADPQPTLW